MRETDFENGARLVDFNGGGSAATRATNFQVHWVASDSTVIVESPDEAFAIFLLGPGRIRGANGDVAAAKGQIALMPAGKYEISASESPVVVVTTNESTVPARQTPRDERVAPVATPFDRLTPLNEPQLWSVDAMAFPPGNPRIKFLQSATLSINMVVYDGPRSRSALSPHSHTDIEQGTLTLKGDYVHHLRTPWGPDADRWREDVHAKAGAGALILIPPETIHTTEGVEEGNHILVDIFAPPRRDFIAKGWVENAADYQDPMQPERPL